LPSFGEKLKSERIKRKITLDQISATTKIGTRMLQALEEEKFSQLPGGIFNKGFVRAYARTVGLDEDQAVADYMEASGESSPARPDALSRDSSDREEEHRISRLEAISDSPSRPMPWGAFAVILLVIALSLSLWTRHRREQDKTTAHPPATKTAQSSGVPSAPGSTSPVSDPSGSTAQLSPAGSQMPSTSQPGATVDQISTPSAQKPVQNSPNPAAAGEFTVVVQAREECWVSIIADGKSTPSELLQAGGQRSVHALKDVVVKAGNAGALDYRLDGKKLEVPGNYGEVKTITIGHAGLISDTLTPPGAH
jgi:cytoskeletal protein RodZ